MKVRIVHKAVWIVLGFALMALVGAERGDEVAVSVAGPHPMLTVADASADEMRCERSYNSDLNLPARFASESLPVRSVVPGVRAGRSTGRCCLRHDFTARDDGGTVCAASRFKYLPALFAGADAADYYVYRLRRLII